jgi:hypothetical protein
MAAIKFEIITEAKSYVLRRVLVEKEDNAFSL